MCPPVSTVLGGPSYVPLPPASPWVGVGLAVGSIISLLTNWPQQGDVTLPLMPCSTAEPKLCHLRKAFLRARKWQKVESYWTHREAHESFGLILPVCGPWGELPCSPVPGSMKDTYTLHILSWEGIPKLSFLFSISPRAGYPSSDQSSVEEVREAEPQWDNHIGNSAFCNRMALCWESSTGVHGCNSGGGVTSISPELQVKHPDVLGTLCRNNCSHIILLSGS